MCGISCVVAVDKRDEANGQSSTGKELQSELDASLEYIKHRGPDAKGIWTSDDQRVGMTKNGFLCSANIGTDRDVAWLR